MKLQYANKELKAPEYIPHAQLGYLSQCIQNKKEKFKAVTLETTVKNSFFDKIFRFLGFASKSESSQILFNRETLLQALETLAQADMIYKESVTSAEMGFEIPKDDAIKVLRFLKDPKFKSFVELKKVKLESSKQLADLRETINSLRCAPNLSQDSARRLLELEEEFTRLIVKQSIQELRIKA